MIQQLTLENFTIFPKFHAPQLARINLLVGENDTGQTSLLKLLYAIAKSCEIYSRQRARPSFKKILTDKLLGTLQPRLYGIGELVTKNAKAKLKVAMTVGNVNGVSQTLHFQFGETSRTTITQGSKAIQLLAGSDNALFIPEKEVLTSFHAIKFTREPHYLLGFDDTYLDLIKMVEIPIHPLQLSEPLSAVNQQLERLFDGQIIQSLQTPEEMFRFQKGHQEFSMALTAEGVKKIGILTTLLQNGRLRPGTMLFIDEPETALHPKAIRLLVAMLVSLALAGVQVFLTTHHYFVLQQLEICARQQNLSIFCFSLLKNSQGQIESQLADLKEGMPPNNPIVEEALKMFEEEVKLDWG